MDRDLLSRPDSYCEGWQEVETNHIVRIAESPGDLDAVRELFQEYWTSFGFTPCFQGFETEVATLPGRSARPRGRFLLGKSEGAPAGCAALRPFDDTRGELKRMYVRPAFRGRKLGEALVEALAAEARAIGYAELIADTI